MTKSNAIYVGMDVHKESIDIALAEGGARGEVRHYGTVGGELHIVYEAGPCGYALYRHLRAKGIECTVVAPSRIPKRAGAPIGAMPKCWRGCTAPASSKPSMCRGRRTKPCAISRAPART